jgi:hypothetical protein
MDFDKIIDSSLHDKLSSVGVSGEGSLFLNNPINRNIQLEYLNGELLKYNPSSVLEIGTHKAYFCYYYCYVLPQVKIITIDLAPWSKTACE